MKRPVFFNLAGLALFVGVTGSITADAAHTQTAKPTPKRSAPPSSKASPNRAVAPVAPASTDDLRLVPPGGSVSNIEDGGISRDGRLIVTTGKDNSALVWEAATERLVRRFPSPTPVYHAQFLGDNDRVVTADQTGNDSGDDSGSQTDSETGDHTDRRNDGQTGDGQNDGQKTGSEEERNPLKFP